MQLELRKLQEFSLCNILLCWGLGSQVALINPGILYEPEAIFVKMFYGKQSSIKFQHYQSTVIKKDFISVFDVFWQDFFQEHCVQGDGFSQYFWKILLIQYICLQWGVFERDLVSGFGGTPVSV